MRRPRDSQAGFSILEVLIGLTVMLIAAGGIVMMLGVSLYANAASLNATNGVSIAKRFLEQFRFRQTRWSGIAPVAMEAPELAVPQNTWTVPLAGAPPAGSGSPWADGVAHDLEGRAAGDPAARKPIFCIHYRISWQPAGTAVGMSEEVLVTVRVAFRNEGAWGDCAPATVNAALGPGGGAQAVILPALMRRVPP